MSDMDHKSLMSSEVFREYAGNELRKDAANKKTVEQIAQDSLDVLNSFDDLQLKINSSKKQKAIFKNLQNLFQTNEKYAATVDPGFVELVLLLNID